MTTKREPQQRSIEKNRLPAYKSGLTRREFLRQTGAAALLAGLMLEKPQLVWSATSASGKTQTRQAFSAHEKTVLAAVQLQLFPDDGDGPSAADINALEYLDWALNDPDNIADGDREFIRKGVGWLEDLTHEREGKSFIELPQKKQQQTLEKIAASKAGENWLSLLIYYLLEALLLDPVYGGNPNGIGWQWLEHQPGFPRPPADKTFRKFLDA